MEDKMSISNTEKGASLVVDVLISATTGYALANTIMGVNPTAGVIFSVTSVLVDKVAHNFFDPLADILGWRDDTHKNAMLLKKLIVIGVSMAAGIFITAKVASVALTLFAAIILFASAKAITYCLRQIFSINTDSTPVVPAARHRSNS